MVNILKLNMASTPNAKENIITVFVTIQSYFLNILLYILNLYLLLTIKINIHDKNWIKLILFLLYYNNL